MRWKFEVVEEVFDRMGRVRLCWHRAATRPPPAQVRQKSKRSAREIYRAICAPWRGSDGALTSDVML